MKTAQKPIGLHRPPDFVVGPPAAPYLRRWHVVPRNRWANIYLHQFLRDDDDRALHDHPWPSISVVARGGYYEITRGPDGTHQRRWHGVGSVMVRWATTAHRIELARDEQGQPVECWTWFFTGPRVREWGFHCPQGWRHWREFVSRDNTGEVGPGCE